MSGAILMIAIVVFVAVFSLMAVSQRSPPGGLAAKMLIWSEKNPGLGLRKGGKAVKMGEDMVAEWNANPTHGDDQAAEDTDTDGDFKIDVRNLFDDIQSSTFGNRPGPGGILGVLVEIVRHNLIILTGDITVASLVQDETITGSTSGATAKVMFSDDLTVGTDQVVHLLLLAGTPDAGGEVWTGAAGTITDTSGAAPVAKTQILAGRMATQSTAAALTSASAQKFTWEAKGTVSVTP